ncbi:MAG: NAD(P)H dehydrogenase assembly family protein [Synechococcus sp.]
MDVSIGDQVRLIGALPYLKTADPMPMLRPPDLVAIDERGEVVGLRPMETAAVRFRRGTFLIPMDQLRCAEEESSSAPTASEGR